MREIKKYKLLDDLNDYNRMLNPDGLNVFELIPYGVSWEYKGDVKEITCEKKVIPLLLKEEDGIALIKSPFDIESNQAFIISPANEIKWDVSCIINKKIKGAIFTDVYYVLNDLCFFVSLNGCDYRFIFEPNTGGISDLIPTY